MTTDSGKFDPVAHLIQLPSKRGRPPSDYLEVKWRLAWIRSAIPDAIIETSIHPKTDDGFAVVTTKVTLPSGAIGTGIGTCLGNGQWSDDYYEKAETRSIGRALAVVGFGTQFCGDDMDEGERSGEPRISDAPVDRPSRQSAPQSRQEAPQRASASSGAQPAKPAPDGASRANPSGKITGPQVMKIRAFVKDKTTGSDITAAARHMFNGTPVMELTEAQANEFIKALTNPGIGEIFADMTSEELTAAMKANSDAEAERAKVAATA